MSTKIYEGRKLKKNYSLKELNDLTDLLYKEIKQIKENYLFNYLIEKTVKTMDKIQYGLINEIQKDTKIINNHLDEFKKDYELKTYLIFYPLEDKTLLLSFSSHPYISKKVLDLLDDYCDFYGYWNNSDEDPSCTKEEWETRKKDWDKAIGPDYIPSNHGLSKDINFDSYDEVLLKRTIKEKYSPNHISLEERKKYLAREIIRKELFKKYEKEFSKESSYSHRKVQILMKMDEELKTEEFKEKIKEKQNELILNEITFEDLISK